MSAMSQVVWQTPASLRSPPRKRRVTQDEHKHTKEGWERRRERIIELFEDNELDVVKAEMAKEGFDATIPQYRHHLKNWGHWKYLKLTVKQWNFIGAKLLKREAEGKETVFNLNGKRIPSAKVEKGLLEKLDEGTFDVSSLRSSLSGSDISAYTVSAGKGVTVTANMSRLRRGEPRISSVKSLAPLDRTPSDLSKMEATASDPNSFLLRRFFDIPSRQTSAEPDPRTPYLQNMESTNALSQLAAKNDRLEKELEFVKQKLHWAEVERDEFFNSTHSGMRREDETIKLAQTIQSSLNNSNQRVREAEAERNRLRSSVETLTAQLAARTARLERTEKHIYRFYWQDLYTLRRSLQNIKFHYSSLDRVLSRWIEAMLATLDNCLNGYTQFGAVADWPDSAASAMNFPLWNAASMDGADEPLEPRIRPEGHRTHTTEPMRMELMAVGSLNQEIAIHDGSVAPAPGNYSQLNSYSTEMDDEESLEHPEYQASLYFVTPSGRGLARAGVPEELATEHSVEPQAYRGGQSAHSRLNFHTYPATYVTATNSRATNPEDPYERSTFPWFIGPEGGIVVEGEDDVDMWDGEDFFDKFVAYPNSSRED